MGDYTLTTFRLEELSQLLLLSVYPLYDLFLPLSPKGILQLRVWLHSMTLLAIRL